MRVLSRRRNFAKAIACGYYEGAGFACSNGTLPCFCRPFCSTPGRPVDAAVASCLPRAPRVCTLRLCILSPVPVGSPSAGSRARCDVGAAATPRWRRRGVQGAQRPCTRLCRFVPTRSARHVPPYQATAEARCDGVGRRPKTPLDDQGERSPASATAAAALWFQSQRQRQMGPHCWHNETAQALQHGCGDDCWRSASLAALHCTRDR